MNFPLPPNEDERLAELHRTGLLDSLSEAEYDDLTRIAAQICGTPISLVTLLDEDRQWFKSNLGLDGITETPRDQAFCAHTILDPHEPLVVPDSHQDPRFSDNALVRGYPNIRFYAGIPLTLEGGYSLGSLCVIDRQPRELTLEQLAALRALGRQVVQLIELRQARQKQEAQLLRLNALQTRLRDFNRVIAHDLKAPLRNINQLADILAEDYAGDLPDDGLRVVDMLRQASLSAGRMVQGTLRYSASVGDFDKERGKVSPAKMIAEFGILFRGEIPYKLEYVGPAKEVLTSEVALRHILQNLVGNAVKFNDKELAVITVACTELEGGYEFTVADNGPGIPEHDREAIFSLFYTTTASEGKAMARASHGVGLNIVRQLVEDLGGELWLESQPGEGTLFRFTLQRS